MQNQQRGTILVLSVSPPYRTDKLPIATIATLGGSSIALLVLPLVGGPGSPVYSSGYRLPAGLALGIYTVSYAWSIAGVPSASTDSFTLVAGGDSGGEVIGLFGYDRPEGRYVLAQLGSGRLVQGRDPYL